MGAAQAFDELIEPITRRVQIACAAGVVVAAVLWLSGRWPLWVAALPLTVLLAWPWLVERYGRKLVGEREG